MSAHKVNLIERIMGAVVLVLGAAVGALELLLMQPAVGGVLLIVATWAAVKHYHL